MWREVSRQDDAREKAQQHLDAQTNGGPGDESLTGEAPTGPTHDFRTPTSPSIIPKNHPRRAPQQSNADRTTTPFRLLLAAEPAGRFRPGERWTRANRLLRGFHGHRHRLRFEQSDVDHIDGGPAASDSERRSATRRPPPRRSPTRRCTGVCGHTVRRADRDTDL